MTKNLKTTLINKEVSRLKSLGHGEDFIKNNLNENKIVNAERERMRSLGYSIRYINHLLVS